MATVSKKTAIVTGGNRGIGFAIAKGLLTQGHTVVLTARSLDSAKTAAEKLQGEVIPIELDVSDDGSIEHAVSTVGQHIDHLDILINNAGVYPDKTVDMLTISRELLASAMHINTFGVIRMVQAFLPMLEKAPSARIVNMSSGMGALDGLTTTAPSYCLSKLALNGATLMLAQSLQTKGIAVNAMCPGWVKTDMGG
ncbi:MAG: SDR family NAD(P)-dependent oxidoreductase, partial [Cyanobacteria bacterium J06635_1]